MKFVGAVLLLVAAAVTFGVLVRPEQVQQSAAPVSATPTLRNTGAANTPAEPSNETPPVAPEAQQKPTTDYRDLDPSDAFQVDKQGKLVVNESVRMYIESLLAQGSDEEIYAVQQDLRAKLPPAAAAQAMTLFDQFRTYESEAQQLAEGFDEPQSEDDALEDLEALRALRSQHFGKDAPAMFSKEEAVNRAFVELMRLERDETLSQEEKERRAAKLRESIPELEDLERRNRAAAELAEESDENG